MRRSRFSSWLVLRGAWMCRAPAQSWRTVLFGVAMATLSVGCSTGAVDPDSGGPDSGTCGAVTACVNADGCCFAGCSMESDDDCAPVCGNGVIEDGEECDSNCPTDCVDGNSCTNELSAGSPATCDFQCAFIAITTCFDGDGCCAPGCLSTNDSDCSATCGNGMVEAGETCDGSCPMTCDDGIPCTADLLTGSPSQCNVQCSNALIASCAAGDGCCPSGCNRNSDGDCPAICGNTIVEPPETCDGSCPTACDDMNACTADTASGSAATCDVQCTMAPVATCASADGCCPPGCNANTDGDCSAMCGNAIVESGETCDGNCPATCNDLNACTTNVRTGTAAQCNVACSYPSITACAAGDGCCPAGCNATNDADCSANCGNGTVEAPETCDGNCPATCDDSNACTTNVRTGTAAQCNVTCSYAPITACANGDGCCPAGCNATNDNTCAPSCGNGVIELGETCDGSCPSACNDMSACTTDVLMGSASSCTARCVYNPITTCTNGDGCCAPGCNANNDTNCMPTCGNGAVESGETCDGGCPTTCNDMNVCTTDARIGMASQCNVQCTFTLITACNGSDGCCPANCNANNDANCSAMCGNGAVESGETCDGNCPATCDDMDACTSNVRTGNAPQCNVLCSYPPLGVCTSGDGCCPPGCNALNDGNCPAVCGNAIVEPGEVCDTTIPAGMPGACPTTCNDGDVCTTDVLTGTLCTRACSSSPITACVSGDGCCPPGCMSPADADCAITLCPPGQIVTGRSGSVPICASPAAAISSYVNTSCFLYFGWRDSCSGCANPPTKWGRVNDSFCETTGSDGTCTTPMLGTDAVRLYGLNPDGDLDDNDKLYAGFRCEPVTGGGPVTGNCPAGQFATGVEPSGDLRCAPFGAVAAGATNAGCRLYFGWRDSCSGCAGAPAKWGRVGEGFCENGTGVGFSCASATLGAASVMLYGLDTDGDVNDDDQFYLGLDCAGAVVDESTVSGLCPAGQFAIGLGGNGAVACASPAPTIESTIDSQCYTYLGWRDGCGNCTTAPAKWGRTNAAGMCTNGAGTQWVCATMPVSMFSLSTDGDVGDDDKLYVGLRCF